MNKNQLKILIAHAMTIFLWGSAFPAIRKALQSFTPEHISLLRLELGGIILLIYAFCRGIKPPKWRDVPFMFFFGICGFTAYQVFLGLGEKTIQAGAASMIIAATPIFTALFGTLFFKEKMVKIQWVGGIISFIGVSILSIGTGGGFTGLSEGVFWILLASLAETIYFVWQKPFLKTYSFVPLTIYTIIGGAISSLIFLPGTIHEVQHASLSSIACIFYLGLFSTILPYFALAYLISETGAGEAASSLYLTPFISLLIGWGWLGEIPDSLSLLGGAVTVLGVLYTSTATLKHRKKKSRNLSS